MQEDHTCKWEDPRDCPTCSKLMPQQAAPRASQEQGDQAEQAAADDVQEEQQGSTRAERRREKQRRHREVCCRAMGSAQRPDSCAVPHTVVCRRDALPRPGPPVSRRSRQPAAPTQVCSRRTPHGTSSSMGLSKQSSQDATPSAAPAMALFGQPQKPALQSIQQPRQSCSIRAPWACRQNPVPAIAPSHCCAGHTPSVDDAAAASAASSVQLG